MYTKPGLWASITERFRKRHCVRIIYKSGAVITATFTQFVIEHDGGVVTKLKWEQNHWCHPQLIHITLQDIDHIDVL